MPNINHIKAYLLGLLVGGGKIDLNTFIIDLPFNKWGMEPKRMNVIATDILTKICQHFDSTYNFKVTYEIANNKWLIKPIANADIASLLEDLQFLNLPTGGFLLSTADLTKAKSILSGITVHGFLSGIFDARASLTKSHRRFNDDAPIVSIEIPGSTKNFKFVVQLCSWMTDLGSITDQILYNHPNQHSASDPDYKGWKKGFKIRFLVKSFLAQHSFALQAKSIDINKIERLQLKSEQTPCLLRKLKQPSPVSVHVDQNSPDLPVEVRNKLFFHYHHFCSVLNCPYAPIGEIRKLVTQKESLINFFPRLTKGMKNDLYYKLQQIQTLYFPTSKLSETKMIVKNILEDEKLHEYSSIGQGIAYLLSKTLNGKRHIGSMDHILKANTDAELIVYSIEKYYESPILIVNSLNERAFLSSSVKNALNQYLIRKKVNVVGLKVNLVQ
ncbi:MAG TPA: hypothetical protein VIM16_06540 [Mucilaginibacter sp.]|jgi:hypothetical protein